MEKSLQIKPRPANLGDQVRQGNENLPDSHKPLKVRE